MGVEILAGVAAVAAVLALVIVLRRPTGGGDMQALRNDMNTLRESSERSLKTVTDVFAKQLQSMTSNVQTSLAATTAEMGNRLDAMNTHVADRLEHNASAMSETSKAVSDRIATVQETFAKLQMQVGEMSEQARQIGEVSKGLSDLEKVLSGPKARGGVGETQLENLLSQVFAREQYEVQYRFASGEIVDALIHLPQGDVAIDSKFSLENFRRMLAAEADADRKALRREFLKDVRKRIDEIASKYIRPAEGTLPLALMYVPAENVYYEAIIRDEAGDDLYEYCVQRRVFPVSPNSLYAYLQTIIVGMNGIRVSQRAESILRDLGSLKLDLEEFDALYGKLGTHLKNAVNNYELSVRQLDKIEDRLQRATGGEESLPLFGEKKRALGTGE
jgi:DNA recombination protein RmuC